MQFIAIILAKIVTIIRNPDNLSVRVLRRQGKYGKPIESIPVTITFVIAWAAARYGALHHDHVINFRRSQDCCMQIVKRSTQLCRVGRCSFFQSSINCKCHLGQTEDFGILIYPACEATRGVTEPSSITSDSFNYDYLWHKDLDVPSRGCIRKRPVDGPAPASADLFSRSAVSDPSHRHL